MNANLSPEQFIFGTCGAEHPGLGPCTREPDHELPHETANHETFGLARVRHTLPRELSYEEAILRTNGGRLPAARGQVDASHGEDSHRLPTEDSHRLHPDQMVGKIDRVLGYVRD